MLALSFKHDLDRLRKELQEDQKQIRFAMSVALNRTAKDVQAAMKPEMQRVFDRPTRYTLNSTRLLNATKHRLTAMVWIKDEPGNDASRYLLPQMEGGARKHKPFEKHLIRQGIMPSNLFAVPGQGARLDRYGNITGGEIERILSAVGAAEQFAGYQANRTAASAKRKGKRLRHFFVAGGKGGHALGIWERTGQGIRPVIVFVKQPRYRARLMFSDTAWRVASERWQTRLNEALDLTLRTRR